TPLMCSKNKGREDYGRQICAVVVLSILGGLVALITIAAGLWFVIYVKNFVAIVERYMRDVFWGYAALGLYLLVFVFFEICGTLRRDRRVLLACIVLLVGLLTCEAGVWVYMYLEKGNTSTDILENLKLYCCEHCLVRYDVDQTFMCSISTSTVDTMDQAYAQCSNRINQWFSKVMWVALGLGAGRVALEALFLLLTIMLRHLIFLAPRSNQVAPSPSDAEMFADVSDVDSIAWTVEDFKGDDYVTNGSYSLQKTGAF
ncbi:hypothetical protein EMCRGX_G033967, partial [Ephydatia muelleri]